MINVQIDLLARSRAHQAKNTDFYLFPNINQIQQVFFFTRPMSYCHLSRWISF